MKAGQIVQAEAGRDKGRFFIVAETDGKFAFICDGKTRPVERPKKKKLIHLKATESFADPEKVRTNKEMRRALHQFNYPQLP